ncbi:MAG: hypothetical protein JKY48_15535 [Flavobacteriales bacterium]|nr:hypothetical protein [Flavobacteriales bacterium]
MKNKIDLLNVFLVLLCGTLAYFFPLKVFLLSFAILGPLHYLTEINWLNTNNYFTRSKKKLWLIIGVLTSLIVIVPRLYFEFLGRNNSDFLSIFLLKINHWSNGAIFFCLLLAVGSQFIKKQRDWGILILLTLLGTYFLNRLETFTMIVGVLIPTIVHVYIFTLLFMLYGAKKTKSKVAYISIVLALVVPIVFTFIPIDPDNYSFSDYFKSALIDNHLHRIPVVFSKLLGLSDGSSFFFYEVLELRMMMFISFIYLYHYLNWFSKTTTIFWHKTLTLKRSAFIGSFWLFLLILFYCDFKIGLLAALFFSFLHVVLEFPLNIASIKSLFISNKK